MKLPCAADAISDGVMCVQDDVRLADVQAIAQERQTTHAAIFDERNRFRGVVALRKMAFSQTGRIFADLLDKFSNPLSVSPETPLYDVVRIFKEEQRDNLVVQEAGGEYVGTITQQSLLQILLEWTQENSAELEKLNTELERRVEDRTKTLAESERRLRNGNRVLEALSSDTSLEQILDLIALSVEAEDPTALCSIQLLDESGKHLLRGAAPSLPDFYNQAIHGIEIGESVGSCGAAAATKRRVIVNDIYTHPNWVKYLTLAEKVGVRSCWSEPVIADAGQVLGTFAIYHREPRAPHEKDLERIQWAASFVRLAIQRKQAQTKLVQSERFNRATLDALSAQVAVLDEAGKIVATNRAWRDFAQANVASWQAVSEGTNYLAICDRAASAGDTAAAAAAEAIRKVLAGEQETWLHEYPCHSTDEQRWFYCRVTRFPGEGPVRVVVAHVNITAMKLAQQDLASARARFETLDRVSPVGIMFFDSQGSCLDVNDRWCEMTGISREAALGDGWQAAAHPEDRAEVFQRWNQAVRAGESIRAEVRVLRQNGEVAWFLSHSMPTRDEQGHVTGFVRACVDITEHKQMEQVLRLLSTDLAALRDEEFFNAVVAKLAELLNCEFCLICRSDPEGPPEQFVTLAYFADGAIQPNFSYCITGTPCEQVVGGNSCIILHGVRERFPQDTFLLDHQIESYIGVPFLDSRGRQVGHVAIMNRRPLENPETIETIIKLFAVSVVAEIERFTTERRYSDLFEFSPDAVVITDRDGLIVEANRQVANLFGWTPAELVGQPVEVLIPAELRANHVRLREHYSQYPELRAMGNGRRDNLVGLRRDGTVFPVDISLSPTQTSEGLFVAAAMRDVTERRRSEEALREAKAFASAVFENVAGLFYVLDQNGVFVRWNAVLQGLLGLSAEQMRQSNAVSVTYEEDRELIATKMHEVFENGHAEAEVRLLTKDGLRYFKLNGTRLEIGGKVYLVGSGIDIHSRKQMEQTLRELNQSLERRVLERTAELTAANEQLIRANQFKSEFLASISHELRTPLNGVLGMNELLLRTSLTNQQREYVEAGITSGRALLSLINDVLDLSKIEAGKIELDLHGSDLEALAYDVLAMFTIRAKQKGVSLSCRLDPETCVRVMCDDTRLRQVLVNLLGNALKFTTQGGVMLESKCVQRDDQRIVVRLSVTDTGLGIPEDKLDRLFSPFSQVDSSTSRQFGGTGLGLSIAKQLVELMGGHIGVNSRVGVGSTFWFEVPFDLVNEAEKTSQRRLLLQGTKVLAVDGVDRERRQIADCLNSWGCPYQHVSSLREAVNIVAQAEADGQPFAVILADCRLAIGDEFVHLQSLARRPDVPVIGLGVGEEDDLSSHLRQLGLRCLLRDPIRPSALFNALASVLAVTPPTSAPSPQSDAVVAEQLPTVTGHILVAEDNHINQMFVRELLKHSGCTCDIANNGDEALTALQQNRYDLVLMDCQMPEMDGFTAAREIRRREAAGELPGRLPIIALTANALKGDRERCLQAGMDDYLTKPLQAAQLQAMLAKFLPPRTDPPTP